MTLVKDMNDPKASILAHFPLNNMSVKLRFEQGVKAPLPLSLVRDITCSVMTTH